MKLTVVIVRGIAEQSRDLQLRESHAWFEVRRLDMPLGNGVTDNRIFVIEGLDSSIKNTKAKWYPVS